MKKEQILDSHEIEQKTRRMAYQIVEENYDEKEIILIGIKPNGFEYAQQLKREIEEIGNHSVILFELTINKSNPQSSDITLNNGSLSLNSKTIIVVDDVANTGKTIYYALKPIMEYSPKKVQAAVLVDRQHKLFPVTADYVGLSLSTTLKEHISVEFNGKKKGKAYLV